MSRAAVLAPGSRGCDTSAATSRAQARALHNAGMAFILRSVGHSAAYAADNLSARELEELLAEGLAVGVYQMFRRDDWSSATGVADAQAAVAAAQAAGYPAGAVLWCDLEGDHMVASGVIAYAGAWAAYVRDSSPYCAGAYRVRWVPESSAQLRAAGFSYLWDASDGTSPLPGAEMVQGRQTSLAGVVIDPDVENALIPFAVDDTDTTPAPPPSETQPVFVGPPNPDSFFFTLLPGETVRERIVRCCDEASAFGAMGKKTLRARYAAFLACCMTGWDYDHLPDVWTSCAVVQGALDLWCRRKGAHQGTRQGLVSKGMFGFWLGDLSFQHRAWRRFIPGGPSPKPGDLFYVAAGWTSNNNHVGRFTRETSPGMWETFEGGGGAQGTPDYGTLTHKSSRSMASFDTANGRFLLGWWDADEMGYEAA